VGAPPHDRRISEGGIPRLLLDMQKEETPRPSSRLSQLDALSELALKRGTDGLSLLKLVRGDLDWIALKAMERDREHRYSTAAELAGDVERYLHHEPIVARPPSTSYRMERFLRRNRTPVVAALAVMLALVLGSGASTFWYVRANASRGEKDALVALCESVRNQVANAHLWFEEAIANDQTLIVERDVYQPLREAMALSERAREGGETPFGEVEPARTDEIAANLTSLHDELANLLSISEERWAKKDTEGRIGEPLDQEYDQLYLDIQRLGNDVAKAAERAAADDWRRAAQAGIAVNGLVLLGAALSATFVLRFWKKRV